MSIFKDFGSAARGNAAPITSALVVALIVSFVLSWASHSAGLYNQMALAIPGVSERPWALLSYPFAFNPLEFMNLFFGALWLWSIGGAVERDLGPTKYLAVWATFSILCGCFVWIGAMVTGAATLMAGPWNVLAAITVLWSTRNPNLQVLFMFIIPLQGKWLGWISVAFVFFSTHPPQVAPFGAIPYILAYMFAANRITFLPYSKSDYRYQKTKKWERYNKSYYEEVQRREKDRDERERLRKLFEGSIRDDDEKREK